ncbi:hypothetical protein QL285_027513 [Trifolium repens]|nr:hypothetical protein QL285_027513 [Trifolium repens]
MELEKEKGKEEEGWEQQIEIVSWFRQTDVHRRGLHASDLWGLEDEEANPKAKINSKPTCNSRFLTLRSQTLRINEVMS